MKKMRNNREASELPALQPFFPQEGMACVAVVEDRDRHPKAWIKELIAITDSICAYSNATRGNIPVKLIFEKPSPTSESQAGTDGSGQL